METAHSVVLPGGVVTDEGIRSEVSFRVLNGRIEERLAEFAHQDLSARAVSQLLATVLESADGLPLDEETIHDMSIADRQFLMLSLASMLDSDQVWLKSQCRHCKSEFDVGLQRSAIPVSMAGSGYPRAQADTKLGRVTMRVPTGRDQEAIVGLSEQEAVARLFELCTVSMECDSEETRPADLDSEDRERIEQALEEIAPELATEVQTECPDCGKPAVLSLNPYRIPELDAGSIYEDIHYLAFHYHWREEDILQMSRERRRRYISMIESHQGMHN
jgi:hypothetical protein